MTAELYRRDKNRYQKKVEDSGTSPKRKCSRKCVEGREIGKSFKSPKSVEVLAAALCRSTRKITLVKESELDWDLLRELRTTTRRVYVTALWP